MNSSKKRFFFSAHVLATNQKSWYTPSLDLLISFTCVTSCHMFAVDLLEPRDWLSGQVPDSMEDISSMDPVMI